MYKSKFNRHLEQFKDIHLGEDAIIFATGPRVKQYKPFEGSEKAIKVGLNRIYTSDRLLESLDYYYFGSHYYMDSEHRKNIKYICTQYSFTKFASAYEEGKSHGDINRGNISPEDAVKIGAVPFENNLSYFTNDPANYCTLGHSIVFPPLQHMLYMGIKKIYLVGCDGGFTSGLNSGDSHLLYWWKRFKKFKDKNFPNVKIVSINPVSLKGWFEEDIYV